MIVTRSYCLHSQNYLMNDHRKIQSDKWNTLNDTIIYKDSQRASWHLSNCNIRLLSFYSHQCLGKYVTFFMCEMFIQNSLHFQLFCPIQNYILVRINHLVYFDSLRVSQCLHYITYSNNREVPQFESLVISII